MDDQKLKSLAEESVQGVKDSVLSDIHSLLQEVVNQPRDPTMEVTRHWQGRGPYDDRTPAAQTPCHKQAMVEIWQFHGDNPDAWIFQVERYFAFYHIAEDQQLTIASFYLDEDALEWYRWLYRNKQLVN